MRTHRLFRLLMTGLLLSVSACKSPQAEKPAADPIAATATVKDIMALMVDPSANGVWTAVSSTVEATKVTEKAPRTDDEWKVVRAYAMTLVESPNLFLMPGRQMAKPGEKSRNPGIELEPDAIQALINKDRETYVQLARQFQDSALVALKAIDAKNPTALSDAGAAIDDACEQCHLKFFYPNQVKSKP
jgi:hypothetical protein